MSVGGRRSNCCAKGQVLGEQLQKDAWSPKHLQDKVYQELYCSSEPRFYVCPLEDCLWFSCHVLDLALCLKCFHFDGYCLVSWPLEYKVQQVPPETLKPKMYTIVFGIWCFPGFIIRDPPYGLWYNLIDVQIGPDLPFDIFYTYCLFTHILWHPVQVATIHM